MSYVPASFDIFLWRGVLDAGYAKRIKANRITLSNLNTLYLSEQITITSQTIIDMINILIKEY